MSNVEEILKNLGLEEILVSPDFAPFTRWLRGLTDENILTEEEIMKVNELKAAGTFIDDADLVKQRIDDLVGNTLSDVGFEELQDELDDLKDTEEAYESLLATANGTELKMDVQLNELNSANRDAQKKVKSLIQKCQGDAEVLEDLTMRNITNYNSYLTSLSSQLPSPMRWCRLDYENYLIGCSNTAMSMKLLFEQTLKLTDDPSVEVDDPEYNKRVFDLYTLQSTFTRTASELYDTELDMCRIDSLIDLLSKPFQPMSCGLMSEQTERLTGQNLALEEHLESLETLIQEKIAQLGYQEAKYCEVENNREKLAAAQKRLEIIEKCEKSASEYVLLSELIWLLIDKERKEMELVFQNAPMDRYNKENEQCARNLEILTKIHSGTMVDQLEEDFAKRVAEIIADDDLTADELTSEEFANPIDRYAERANHSAVLLEKVVSDSYQLKIADFIKDCNDISARLNPLIGNGPTIRPNIWNLPVLAESQIYKPKLELIFDSMRMMRNDFMENYHQPFTNDELWRRRQLLWIWFLTDKEAFLEAFQKTVSTSMKSSNHGNLSIVGGIKRKN